MSALGHTENEDPDVSTTEDTIQPFKSFQAANALTDGGDEPKYNWTDPGDPSSLAVIENLNATKTRRHTNARP